MSDKGGTSSVSKTCEPRRMLVSFVTAKPRPWTATGSKVHAVVAPAANFNSEIMNPCAAPSTLCGLLPGAVQENPGAEKVCKTCRKVFEARYRGTPISWEVAIQEEQFFEEMETEA